MHIGFEAKRLFRNKTGLGNYGRDLIRSLTRFAPEHTYWAYTPPSSDDLFQFKSPNFYKIQGKTWGSAELWRQWGQTTEPSFKNLHVYHGLSGELPLGLKVPSVVTLHDLIFERYPQFYSKIDRKIHFLKFKSAAKRAQRVVAISEQTKADIHQFLEVPLDKIDVIYQGCHSIFSERFSKEVVAETRAKFGLPNQFILGVGTLEARKNMGVVIEALRDLDIPLVLVGGRTRYTDQIQLRISELRMQNRVWFPQQVQLTELAHLYQSAYMLVYPSLFEGFGIPILEGLKSGIPVLTGKGGCFPEAGGPAAFYLDQKDPEAWRETIQQVVTSPFDQQVRIQTGLKWIQKFEPEVIIPQWIQLYQSLSSDRKVCHNHSA